MQFYPSKIEWSAINTGGLRILRAGEILLATTLYGNSIRYNQVWIHKGSYLPLNLQNNLTAMTPNGEMWFQEGVYREDFSMAQISMQHMFLHEMMHVWQHQKGMWVRTRGAFSWAVDYSYSLDKENLLDYGLEQQASIVSDYWLLKHHTFDSTNANIKLRNRHSSEPAQALLTRYDKILGNFPG